MTPSSSSLSVSRLHLHADSPFRPPDWRWQLALAVRARQAHASELDTYGRKAVDFLAALDGAVTAQARARLRKRFPMLTQAYGAYAETAPQVRAELEARVLADDTAERMTGRTGMNPHAVAWFEKLYYDVRPRLSQTSYVLHLAIGVEAVTYIRDRDDSYAVLWKLFGYSGGPYVLDLAIQSLIPPLASGKAASMAQAEAWGPDAKHVALAYRSLVELAKLRPLTADTKLALLEASNSAAKVAAEAKALGGVAAGTEQFLTGIQAALDRVTWGTGTAGRKAFPRLTALDDCAAEPRADELLRAALGDGRLENEHLLRAARLPSVAAAPEMTTADLARRVAELVKD
jgi:hypothetical protein